MHNNKKILILSTGGTIAGKGEDCLQSSQYQAGAIKAEKLLEELPAIDADLSVQEIAQIDSIEMESRIWQKLLDTLKESQGFYDGFVITHGTDTMEESSFVLDLLYRGEKPVVFVGAMRPSNAIGSDGMKNLCNAIALASYEKAKGVMVLMNDKIYNPKTIYKAHTHNLDAFKSRNGGEMGYVIDGEVCLFYQPWRFFLFVEDIADLPKVEIAYMYAGIRDLPSWNQSPRGLVIAGCGAGNIPSCIKNQLKSLQNKGVIIVASSRGSEGLVTQSDFVPSFGLNPAKARILLSLCLQTKQTKEEIKNQFALIGL